MMSAEKFGRYKAGVDENIERRARLALRNKAKSGKRLKKYGGLSEGIGLKTYLHGPMDFAKTPKLRFRVGDLNQPKRRKRRTSSREEGEVDAQTCPCGKAIESRTHIVGECEMHKEERDVLEREMREIDECDMEGFSTLLRGIIVNTR